MPPVPIQFLPTPSFWDAVHTRVPSNEGHAHNIFEHGPFVGSIGEVAFEFWFKNQFSKRLILHCGEKSYDYVVQVSPSYVAKAPSPPPGLDVVYLEVKTKLRSAFPLNAPETYNRWEMSVPHYLLDRMGDGPGGSAPDALFAVSVQSALRRPTLPEHISSIVVIGWIPYTQFFEKKRWIPRGSRMGSQRLSPESMWNVYVAELFDPTEL